MIFLNVGFQASRLLKKYEGKIPEKNEKNIRENNKRKKERKKSTLLVK
jgi:hypothetical protein